jgi:hypothetical protein
MILKNTTGWNNNGNGDNSLGFTAQPGGGRYLIEGFGIFDSENKRFGYWNDYKNPPRSISLGIVGESHFKSNYWDHISSEYKFNMINLNHYNNTRPDFISWKYTDLMHSTPFLWKKLSNLPLLSWTIDSIVNLKFSQNHSHQVVFENLIL